MLVRATVLIIGMGAVGTDTVDVAGYDEGEDLLPCPQGPGLQDGWLWDLAVPRGQEHQEVHHLPLEKKSKKDKKSELEVSPLGNVGGGLTAPRGKPDFEGKVMAGKVFSKLLLKT